MSDDDATGYAEDAPVDDAVEVMNWALERATHPVGQFFLQLIPWRGPQVAELVKGLDKHRRARRAERAGDVVGGAADAFGVKEFLARVGTDEAFEDLVYRTGETAIGARDAAKRRALRRALIIGARDPARVDEQRLLVDALADLEPAHARVLAQLVDVREQPRSEEAPAPDSVTREEVVARFPGADHVMGALLARLVAAGLVETIGTYGSEFRYRAGDLGVLAVDYLRDPDERT